jgi:hypothetical protein
LLNPTCRAKGSNILHDNLISIENYLPAEIRQVTNFKGLKSDQWLKSVIEIGLPKSSFMGIMGCLYSLELPCQPNQDNLIQ